MSAANGSCLEKRVKERRRRRTVIDKRTSLFKGMYPLWGRQIPYTMMKFASFETIVKIIYASLPGKMQEYSAIQQTAVAFTGGYLAGILCAIVSHPAGRYG